MPQKVINKTNIILILFIISFFLFVILVKKNNERIEGFQTDNYLYPIKNVNCGSLQQSFMPKSCYINGNLNPYANCKCEDANGNCKICYDTIDHTNNNAKVIYNSS